MARLFAFLIFATALMADYYSLKNPSLDETGTLEYEGGLSIHVKEGMINIQSGYDLSWIMTGSTPQEYEMVTVETEVETSVLPPVEGDDKKAKEAAPKKQTMMQRYSTCNFLYLLKNDMPHTTTFALKGAKKTYIVKRESNPTSIYHPIRGEEVRADLIEYRIIKALDDSPVEYSTILRKYVDLANNLIAVELMGRNVHRIKRVTGPALDDYNREAQARETVLKNMDMSKDKLFFAYESMYKGNLRNLKVTYEMAKKNIKVVTSSPISLFDPANKSSALEENVGFMRSVKGDLYELKKVQIIDGTVDVNWVNLPNKQAVKVDYISNGQKDSSAIAKSPKQQFYGIEGVIYLASWMKQNKVDKKIFSFINGSMPTDMTMLKTSANRYEMQKKGNTIYSFDVDGYSIVTKITDPAYDNVITLKSKDSTTTRKNKEYLSNLRHRSGIVLVKE